MNGGSSNIAKICKKDLDVYLAINYTNVDHSVKKFCLTPALWPVELLARAEKSKRFHGSTSRLRHSLPPLIKIHQARQKGPWL